MKKIRETLMSQYANSPIICSLIEGLNTCLDTDETISDFYSIAWNINTASGYGLDIWGRIVGVGRNISTPQGSYKLFGFNTGTEQQSFFTFNDKPFSGNGANFGTYQLPDDKYRTLIMIKAASNIVYATAPNINKFLRMIFQGKRAYYLITGHMKARYFFEFIPNVFEKHIIYQLKLLPRPCGVLVEYREMPPRNFFGFAGTGLQPFNQGVFA